jgi:organic hydroperoxide reductase OsmC/OhrA
MPSTWADYGYVTHGQGAPKRVFQTFAQFRSRSQEARPKVPARAEALIARADEVCPYSNATRNNIDVKLTFV